MHLLLPHRPSVPSLLLSMVYASAIAVALANPGTPTLAGVVVLAGLTARWVAHHRRAPSRATVAALTPEAAAGTAPAA